MLAWIAVLGLAGVSIISVVSVSSIHHLSTYSHVAVLDVDVERVHPDLVEHVLHHHVQVPPVWQGLAAM